MGPMYSTRKTVRQGIWGPKGGSVSDGGRGRGVWEEVLSQSEMERKG